MSPIHALWRILKFQNRETKIVPRFQIEILVYLAMCDGGCALSSLYEHVEGSESSKFKHLHQLVETGRIIRTSGPDNQRNLYLSLTDIGRGDVSRYVCELEHLIKDYCRNHDE